MSPTESAEEMPNPLTPEPKTTNERLILIERGIIDLQEAILTFSHRLFGNAQPGVLERLEKRLDSIETWRDLISGGHSALMRMLSFTGAAVGAIGVVAGMVFGLIKLLQK